ncbi:NAD(P)-dependent oxidoreductase, partial [Planctomycetota bacterium]
YDPVATPPDAEKLGIEIAGELEQIFKESDYISVHVPKNERTENMIGAEQIDMMKRSVRLVNCARGGIINEEAMYKALSDGRIAGAAIDVFPTEPPENTGFSELESCLVTPHLGASTSEAQVEVAVEAAQILVDAIKGGPVKNALNAPSLSGAMPEIVVQYAELARRIGTVVGVVSPGHIKNVEIKYRGSIAEMDVEAVSLNFMIGLLQRHFDMTLNMVNVNYMAKERGISVNEIKNVEPEDVAASFSARIVTDKIDRTVTGSVFGGSLLRIIDIDGFSTEITPEGSVLIIFNDDKPGVIGAVGNLCGKHGLNICTMGVGQKLSEGKAALAISLDAEPSAEAVEEFGKLDFVNEIYVCKLD